MLFIFFKDGKFKLLVYFIKNLIDHMVLIRKVYVALQSVLCMDLGLKNKVKIGGSSNNNRIFWFYLFETGGISNSAMISPQFYVKQ